MIISPVTIVMDALEEEESSPLGGIMGSLNLGGDAVSIHQIVVDFNAPYKGILVPLWGSPLLGSLDLTCGGYLIPPWII